MHLFSVVYNQRNILEKHYYKVETRRFSVSQIKLKLCNNSYTSQSRSQKGVNIVCKVLQIICSLQIAMLLSLRRMLFEFQRLNFFLFPVIMLFSTKECDRVDQFDAMFACGSIILGK